MASAAARVGRDTLDYLAHPRRTSLRALEARSLRDGLAVTAIAILLTALPLAAVPPPRRPPTGLPRPAAAGLAHLAGHRPLLAALALLATVAVSGLGYAGTCLAVRVLAGGPRAGWRRLLAAITYVNCLSALSALVPLPALALQVAGVSVWERVNAVTGPASLLLGAYVAVPAWHAVREGAGLRPAAAAAAIAVPVAAAVVLVGAAALAGLELAFP